MTDDDSREIALLSVEAAKKKSEVALNGRTIEKATDDFILGFCTERALAKYVGAQAFNECLEQQNRGFSSYGPDFGIVDSKGIDCKYGIDAAIRADLRLIVKDHVLMNDKKTKFYALVIQDVEDFYLVGWATRDEVLKGMSEMNGKTLRISKLHPAETFVESCVNGNL